MATKALPFSFRRRAERLAMAEREALALTPTCRLDPHVLAARHGIRVVALSGLPGISEETRAHLMRRDAKDLSALVIGEPGQAILVVNDSHTPERQANSICHEVAHVLLRHAAGAFLDEDGVRVYPEEQEAEANWLAGAFLVPVQGLRYLHRKQTRPQIEETFGVSKELLRWRCNMHGMAEKAA